MARDLVKEIAEREDDELCVVGGAYPNLRSHCKFCGGVLGTMHGAGDGHIDGCIYVYCQEQMKEREDG